MTLDLIAASALEHDTIASVASAIPSTTRDCSKCRRPRSVCLCDALPQTPIRTRGRVLILQHPFERRKRLATVALLEQCLQDLVVLPGRRFQWAPSAGEAQAPGQLGAVVAGAAAGRWPLYLLFPGAGAADLAAVAASPAHRQQLTQYDHAAATQLAARPSSPAVCQQQDTCGNLNVADVTARNLVQGAAEQAVLHSHALAGGSCGGSLHQQSLPALHNEQHSSPTQRGAAHQRPAPVPAAEADSLHQQQAGRQIRQQPSLHSGGLPADPGPSAAARLAEQPNTAWQHSGPQSPPPAYVLLVIDGTWLQAKEMFKAAAPWLLGQAGPAQQVALSLGAACAAPVRREPAAGCMTTMEAVARALALLEADEEGELLASLLAPLDRLAQLQAQWDPAMRARLEGRGSLELPGKRQYRFLKSPAAAPSSAGPPVASS